MTIILNILTITPFLVAIVMTYYVIRNRDNISKFVSVRKLGVFERDLEGLIQVVVLAHRIEDPVNTFGEAVEDNFEEGVKYLFLVSSSASEEDLENDLLVFKEIAKRASNKSKKEIKAGELVQMKKLPYEWHEVPYIFYQFQKEDSLDQDDNRYTLAYRGNQKGEGIADFYEKLSASQSHALLTAILHEAPKEISNNLKLLDSEKVVQFTPRLKVNIS